MISRRSFVVAGLGWGILAAASPALAHHRRKKTQFTLDRRFEPQMVDVYGYPAGMVVVDPNAHHLYLVYEGGRALRYGVGVGRAGLTFKGSAVIARKAKWPSWRPTDNMIRREPKKYARYARGVPGGPNNPLGARALYLYRDGRDTYYRIHGTNQPSSIGRSVSSGCIRMLNAHVADLYERVPTGTPVVVL